VDPVSSSLGTVEPVIPRNCGTRYIHPQKLCNKVYIFNYASSRAQEPGICILRHCGADYTHPQELLNQIYLSSGTVDQVNSSSITVESGIFILRNCGTLGILIPKNWGTRYIHPQTMWNQIYSS
jgi:hypothetical protein